MRLAVRRIERGDLLSEAFGEKTDLILFDEPDSMSSTSLNVLLSGPMKNTATTKIFLCLPSAIGRFTFGSADITTIELPRLSLFDARNYLSERASSIGMTTLFDEEASDLVIDLSRGLPRLLQSIASHAFFTAASAGASQISVAHVSTAMDARTL